MMGDLLLPCTIYIMVESFVNYPDNPGASPHPDKRILRGYSSPQAATDDMQLMEGRQVQLVPVRIQA